MNIMVLIWGLALFNLLIVSALLYYFRSDARWHKEFLEMEGEANRLFHADISDRIKRIEQLFLTSHENNAKLKPLISTPPEKNRIESAMRRLQDGYAPDEVGREYGYSRSEMGIIAATARPNDGRISAD